VKFHVPNAPAPAKRGRVSDTKQNGTNSIRGIHALKLLRWAKNTRFADVTSEVGRGKNSNHNIFILRTKKPKKADASKIKKNTFCMTIILLLLIEAQLVLSLVAVKGLEHVTQSNYCTHRDPNLNTIVLY
jgi:hypothetical protein